MLKKFKTKKCKKNAHKFAYIKENVYLCRENQANMKVKSNMAQNKRPFYIGQTAPLILEKASAVPVDTLVPNEAMSVREMLIRTERGQRLDVHTRMRSENIPDNMYTSEEIQQLAGKNFDLNDPAQLAEALNKAGEKAENTPPDNIHDIVDVLRYSEEQKARRAELKERSAKRIANARRSAPVGNPSEPEPTTPPKSNEEA